MIKDLFAQNKIKSKKYCLTYKSWYLIGYIKNDNMASLQFSKDKQLALEFKLDVAIKQRDYINLEFGTVLVIRKYN